jgi:hypothetical protein
LIKASQVHHNARQLTAPKAMVLSGESATLQVWTTKAIRTDASGETETITIGDNPVVINTIDDTYTDFSSGVRLSITPTILNKKYVLLRISTYLCFDIGTAETTVDLVVRIRLPRLHDLFCPLGIQFDSNTCPCRSGTVLLGGQTLTASRQKERAC